MKRTLFLSLVAATAFSNGQVQGGMDHINEVNLDLVSTPANGRVQVFSDVPDQSRMIVDDFFADKNILTDASMAFEFSTNMPIDRPDGWRLSIWDSLANAANSGNDFTGNTVQSVFIPFSATNWVQTSLFGSGASSQAFQISFSNLNLDIGTGVRYIGIAPIQSSTNQLKWLILGHKNPSLLGNNTPNNSFGINPSGALGLGTSYSIGTNAAYSVNLVPEPFTVLGFVAGIVAMSRIRNAKSKAQSYGC